MTQGEFSAVCDLALQTLKELAPYDTGNLAHNAVRLEFISPNEALLYVDEKIAPYMPYTNEPWVSPYWNGKKNPNEGWFDAAAELVAEVVAKFSRGEIKIVED